MPVHSLPAHATLAAELDALESGLVPAELHGSLCGYLSGGGRQDRAGWFRAVMADPLLPEPEAGSALDQLYAASVAQLDSPDFGFELLLPPDDQAVDVRGDGLLAWCRGFLGGFGLAAGAEPPLSETAAMILESLARYATEVMRPVGAALDHSLRNFEVVLAQRLAQRRKPLFIGANGAGQRRNPILGRRRLLQRRHRLLQIDAGLRRVFRHAAPCRRAKRTTASNEERDHTAAGRRRAGLSEYVMSVQRAVERPPFLHIKDLGN